MKMRRGVYILPNLFTTGNLFCGFWAIISVLQEQFFYAAVAILLACVFDILDGKVARLAGATSKFGVQYDSLADLVSFGIAPALLAFSWALRPYGKFGWLAAFLFVAIGTIQCPICLGGSQIFQRPSHPSCSVNDCFDHPPLPRINRNSMGQGYRCSRDDICIGFLDGVKHSIL
jgi:phosphatidylglycerophosphate synthase